MFSLVSYLLLTILCVTYSDCDEKSDILRNISNDKASRSGATYVRWGKNSCPVETATVVYHGYMAGKHSSQKGSGTNTLCLHNTPKWGSYKDGTQGGRAFLYGAEYEPDDGSGKNLVPGFIPSTTDDQIAPCTVCRLKFPRGVLMIPGTTECGDGWTKEYDGNLMAPNSGQYAGEFLCIDRTADIISGGKNSNQFTLFPTEARCGSLLCPPYVEGREVTCVVCSG